ncbi:MAG: tripartite tricarboxylate transporter TctB family protein [Gammaproteobacteria bacterium]|nr:tripartite tricarboxylate transporter TctB family protein [Gammaproteobacteria bacterium]
MSMPFKNIVAGIVLLLFGIAYGWFASDLPDRGAINVPGPPFFPQLIAAMIVCLAAVLISQGAVECRKSGFQSIRLAIPVKAIAVLALIAVFIALLPIVGFLFGGIPFFAMLMYLSGANRWGLIALGSVAIPVVLFYLFRDGFHILLPHASWM